VVVDPRMIIFATQAALVELVQGPAMEIVVRASPG
jgi:hypothetical protein